MNEHNFHEDLQESRRQAHLPVWELLYRHFFPDLHEEGFITIEQSGWHQGAGIDRTLILRDGRVVYVDDKTDQWDTPFIALEEFSCLERNVEGWITKPLLIDYILYVKPNHTEPGQTKPTPTAWLLPFIHLQEAWRRYSHATAWKKDPSRRKVILNQGYNAVVWLIEPARVLAGIKTCYSTTEIDLSSLSKAKHRVLSNGNPFAQAKIPLPPPPTTTFRA